jgi:hypothetical protein
VHQVGSVYKILQECRSTKHKKMDDSFKQANKMPVSI